MPDIKQFRYGNDNLAYIIYSYKMAMVIDGGAVNEILRYIDTHNLNLEFITNTHYHADHTCGNKILADHTDAKLLTFEDLTDGSEISLGTDRISVMRTPGHSRDSVCFYTGSALISGDTLFNGTIGNCFTGDLKGFFLSVKRIMALPPETIIYAGHDYMKDSLAFAEYLEPENPDIARYRGLYNPNHVYSTLAEELKINPYLRFNEKSIEKILINRELPHGSEWDRWKSLMSIV